MIAGERIKEHLAQCVGELQAEKSSFWSARLTNFDCDENTLKKNWGFGSFSPRRKWRKKPLHGLLQLPYKVRFGNYAKLFPTIGIAKKITSMQGRVMDLDVLRQVFTLVFCANKIDQFSEKLVSLVIGDGFGTLSTLICCSTKHKVICVNLNEVLYVDYLFARQVLSEAEVALAETEEDLQEALASKQVRLILVRASNHSLIRHAPVDVAFNVVSMQEMDPSTIEQYFDHMRSCPSESLYFYCCNRIEKVLPDGTAVRFDDYPWSAERDEVIVDELCPWHQFFYLKKPPFYFRYEGPVQHRLSKLQ